MAAEPAVLIRGSFAYSREVFLNVDGLGALRAILGFIANVGFVVAALLAIIAFGCYWLNTLPKPTARVRRLMELGRYEAALRLAVRNLLTCVPLTETPWRQTALAINSELMALARASEASIRNIPPATSARLECLHNLLKQAEDPSPWLREGDRGRTQDGWLRHWRKVQEERDSVLRAIAG